MDHVVTDLTATLLPQTLASEPDKTENRETSEGAIHAELRADNEQKLADSVKIGVPNAIEELWFKPVDIGAPDTSSLDDKDKPAIIARREWGRKNENWDYLLSRSDESLLWYGRQQVKHVAQTSEKQWSDVVRTEIYLDVFKVSDEMTMRDIVFLEFQIGDSRVDPLHSDKTAWPDLIANIAPNPTIADQRIIDTKASGGLGSSKRKNGDEIKAHTANRKGIPAMGADLGARSTISSSFAQSNLSMSSEQHILEAMPIGARVRMRASTASTKTKTAKKPRSSVTRDQWK